MLSKLGETRTLLPSALGVFVSTVKLQSNKLEVALQQLDMASKLYVMQENVFSIHTLAGAAEGILGQLLDRTDKKQASMFEKMRHAYSEHLGRPATNKEVASLVNTSRNALKHARDPREDVFAYESKDADVMLLRALANYQVLTGVLTDTMESCLSCLRNRSPEIFPACEFDPK